MKHQLTIPRMVMAALCVVIVILVGINVMRYQTETIPVLKTPVTAGTVINADMLTAMQWPMTAHFEDLVTDAKSLEGKQAAGPIAAGTPLSAVQFIDPATGQSVPTRIVDPAFPLSTDADLHKLKIFVEVNLRRSGGGIIEAGDYVNILATRDGQGEWLVQKVHILDARDANGQQVTADSKLLPAGYLLSLTPEQAAVIGAIPSDQLTFVPVRLDSPDIPGVPSGVNRTAATPPASIPGGADDEDETAPNVPAAPDASASATPEPTQSPDTTPEPSLTPAADESPDADASASAEQ